MRIERRIFVVGVPRSGTTLVQSLLASHSAVTSFTESHFFSRHFKILPLGVPPILIRNPQPRVREFLLENAQRVETRSSSAPAQSPDGRVSAEIAEVAGTPAPLLPFKTRSVARQLVAVLDGLALQRGRSTWVEKTPRHLRYVPFLDDLVGRERRVDFVHVIRDGIEVVASLFVASQQWQRAYDLRACARRWNRDVSFSLGRVSGPRDHFVFYEDVTTRPEATLERLLSALDLDWESDLIADSARTATELVTDEETWKHDVPSGVRRSGTAETALTSGQRERARRWLRDDLYDRLYARAGLERRGGSRRVV